MSQDHVIHPENVAAVGTSAAQQPLHVFHIVDKLGIRGASVHGITQALSWWITSFDQQAFTFHVISLREPEVAGDILINRGIPVTYLSKNKFDPRTLTDLVRLIRAEKPAVLHLHGFGATNFGRIASRLTGVPNIVHEHIVFDHQPFYQTVADTLLSPLTDRAIAVSTEVGEYMVNDRHIKESQLVVQPIGLPLASFRASDAEILQQKRAELGIPQDAPLIALIGRLDKQKGQGVMIRAMAQIVREVPDARLLLVGDGSTEEWLRALVSEHQLKNQVIFAGYRTDIADITSLADVIAIPSRFEGGPITLFEAMSMSKPVVGTPVGLIPEVLEDGKTGFLVPVESVDLLAEKVAYLLKNPEIAQAMGERAAQVVQDYDLQKSVDHLVQVYRELAGSRKAAA